ncbi:hypothetical protein PSPO01_14688 [Paraphaeosphaeria sporulosa]
MVISSASALPLSSSTHVSAGISGIPGRTNPSPTSIHIQISPPTLLSTKSLKLFRDHTSQLDEWPEVHRAAGGLLHREPHPKKQDKHRPTPTPTHKNHARTSQSISVGWVGDIHRASRGLRHREPATRRVQTQTQTHTHEHEHPHRHTHTHLHTHKPASETNGPLELGSAAQVKRPANYLLTWDWHERWKKRGAHPPPSSSTVPSSIASQASSSLLPTEESGAAARMHRHASHLADNLPSTVSNITIAASTPTSASSLTLVTLIPVANPGYMHKVAPGLVRPRVDEATPKTTMTSPNDVLFQPEATHRTVSELKRVHTYTDSTTRRTRTSSSYMPHKSKRYAYRIAPHLKHGGSNVTTTKSVDEEGVTFEAEATHHRATALFPRDDDENPSSTTGSIPTAIVASSSATTAQDTLATQDISAAQESSERNRLSVQEPKRKHDKGQRKRGKKDGQFVKKEGPSVHPNISEPNAALLEAEGVPHEVLLSDEDLDRIQKEDPGIPAGPSVHRATQHLRVRGESVLSDSYLALVESKRSPGKTSGTEEKLDDTFWEPPPNPSEHADVHHLAPSLSIRPHISPVPHPLPSTLETRIRQRTSSASGTSKASAPPETIDIPNSGSSMTLSVQDVKTTISSTSFGFPTSTSIATQQLPQAHCHAKHVACFRGAESTSTTEGDDEAGPLVPRATLTAGSHRPAKGL